MPNVCPHCGQELASATTDMIGPVPPTPDASSPPIRGSWPVSDVAAITADHPSGIPGSPSAHAPQAGSEPAALPVRIGRFEIRQKLGEGAFGIVYRAFDPQLDRYVALKVAKPSQLAGARQIKRFLHEAKAVANLRHPNIVPVFDSGCDAGYYYIASAFIPGRSLAEILGERTQGRGPDSREAVRQVRPLAEALAYAHKRGVVHRDVKPANVMLDEQGEPLLVDFGLAARAEGAEKLTQEGVGVGTPAYLAPEQAEGLAGPASDQYALGCTLYELLTRRTPFAGPPHLQLILHRTQEPAPPRSVNPAVSRDLDTICRKCLEKDPGQRYPSCQALADDLRRWLDGEPIVARPLGLAERLSRWVRKEPQLAAAVAAAASLLVAVAAVLALLRKEADEHAAAFQQVARRAEDEATRARKAGEDARREAEEARRQKDRAEWQAYLGQIALAEGEWRSPQWPRSIKLLESCDRRWRGWEHSFLDALFHHQGQGTLQGRGNGPMSGVAFSPDGTRLAAGRGDGTIMMWDVRTGHALPSPQRLPHGVGGVAFSPDGTRLAIAYFDGTVMVWDVVKRLAVFAPIKAHAGVVWSVAFSPDGTRLATAGDDKTVRVCDAGTGQGVFTIQSPTAPLSIPLSGVSFSPDGRLLAAIDGFDQVTVWDVGTRQKVHTLGEKFGPMIQPRFSPTFSPDGNCLASGSRDGTVVVWDVRTGRESLARRVPAGPVTGVAFSPDGGRLAASDTGAAKVWDSHTGQDLLTLRSPTGYLRGLAFSPDGSRLAAGNGTGKATVWDARTGQEPLSLAGHRRPIVALAFSPDGARLASGSVDQILKVWDASAGREVFTLRRRIGLPSGLAFSRDGSRLVSAHFMWTEWEAATGREIDPGRLLFTGGLVSAFSPDRSRLVSGSLDRTVKLYDVSTRQALLTSQVSSRVTSVAYSLDGSCFASGSDDGRATVWDAVTGQEACQFQAHTREVTGLSFSPDGRHLASVGTDRTAFGFPDPVVRIWNARTGQAIFPPLRGHTSLVRCVVYSRDGTRLVSAGNDQTVKFWDVRSGEETLTLRGHISPVTCVTFSPDGAILASGSEDGAIKLWDARNGRNRDVWAEMDLRHRACAPTWYAEDAAKAEQARDWFVAAWNLDRLLRLQPWDAPAHLRRARALAELKQPERAALHVAQALLLDPLAGLSSPGTHKP